MEFKERGTIDRDMERKRDLVALEEEKRESTRMEGKRQKGLEKRKSRGLGEVNARGKTQKLLPTSSSPNLLGKAIMPYGTAVVEIEKTVDMFAHTQDPLTLYKNKERASMVVARTKTAGSQMVGPAAFHFVNLAKNDSADVFNEGARAMGDDAITMRCTTTAAVCMLGINSKNLAELTCQHTASVKRRLEMERGVKMADAAVTSILRCLDQINARKGFLEEFVDIFDKKYGTRSILLGIMEEIDAIMEEATKAFGNVDRPKIMQMESSSIEGSSQRAPNPEDILVGLDDDLMTVCFDEESWPMGILNYNAPVKPKQLILPRLKGLRRLLLLLERGMRETSRHEVAKVKIVKEWWVN
ncbi:hypothetical protein ACH5RR_029698 [Cinchona calisaya]|uniref:Uncharacterized protein n=1 Tax=Cinchona calisaya TaxID=153742 RepID=A0ABD2YSG6_9GENT